MVYELKMAGDVNATDGILSFAQPYVTGEIVLIISISLAIIVFIFSLVKSTENDLESLIGRTIGVTLIVNGLILAIACLDVNVLSNLIIGSFRIYVMIGGLAMLYLGYTKVFAPFNK